MTNSQRLVTVRECFERWIGDGEIESESILIRDEFFCGRRFCAAQFSAVWFIEEDTLKIFDDQRQLLVVLRGEEIDTYAASRPVGEDETPTILSIPLRLRAETGDSEASNAKSDAMQGETYGDSIRRAA